MLLNVEGLKKLAARDYYVLYMTRTEARRRVRELQRGRTAVDDAAVPGRVRPRKFNGLEIARWDHNTRKAVPVVDGEL
jgi:hypothetical protein